MAKLRHLIVVALVAAVAPGCRWWRRRHPPARAAAHRTVATQCYDARFVTGQRLSPRIEGRHPAVAGAGDARVIAWRTADGVWAARGDGSPPVRLGDAAATEGPTVVVDARGADVAWVDAQGAALASWTADAAPVLSRWQGVSGVALARSGGRTLGLALAPGGVILARRSDDSLVPLTLPGERTAPAVVAVNGGFVATWGARDGDAWALRGQALGVDGTPSGPGFVVARATGPIGRPSVARSGLRLLFAWSDHRSGDAGLHVASTDLAGGHVGDAQRLSIRYTDEATAAVTGTPSGFGVAWSEPVGGGAPRSYLARVDLAGRRLGSALRVAVEDDSGMERPALRWERGGFMLAMERADGALELRRTGPRGCDMPVE